jgi:STE24 endopeptidase
MRTGGRLAWRTGAVAAAMTAWLAAGSVVGAASDAPRPAPVDRAGVPAAAQASPHFDVETATNAYIEQIPAAEKARSDAYFEGGYWLILWNFLYGAAVWLALLGFGWSAAMRDLAERLTRFGPARTFLYWVQFLATTAVLSFPLTVYRDYVREHRYGLATQAFGPWLGDQVKALVVGALLGGVAVVVLFAVVRRFARSWWIWGSAAAMALLVAGMLIGPVYLTPLFNAVKPLQDPAVTAPILRLARANGIPARDVFEVEESRHSKRVSANVSGIGRTMRISLNDNLLARASLPEIEAVMAHEMGHYVLNHIYKMLMFFLIVVVAAFACLQRAIEAALARWGGRWRVRGAGDPAVLPLAALLVSLFGFVMTPVVNTFIRVQEVEADLFGVNASAQPDGLAQAAVHLSEYRKMSPGRVEEWIFFDHPSGRNRIRAAMRWKAEHLAGACRPEGGGLP